MPNVVFMVNLPENKKPGRNNPYTYSIKSWSHYCKKYGHELFLLTERIGDENIINANWHKLYAFQLLDHNEISYDRILIVDGDTIIHPDAPDIFQLFEKGYLYAAHNDGSYDWLLRSMEVYSKELFDGFMFPFTEYINSGVILVDRASKYFYDYVLTFYNSNREKIQGIQDKYHVGTDQPVLNFLIQEEMMFGHAGRVSLRLLPYEWNMQDLCRKEILDPEMTFTKYGWLYHFNAIPSNYKLMDDNTSPVYQWMRYTYERLYG